MEAAKAQNWAVETQEKKKKLVVTCKFAVEEYPRGEFFSKF
jgi:hypothetical protein